MITNPFHKPRYTNVKYLSETNNIPKGTWLTCEGCNTQLLRKQVINNLSMCPKCTHHFRMNAKNRITLLIDPDTFQEQFQEIGTTDPLGFCDSKGNYPQKIQKHISQQGINEGIITGTGKISTYPVVIGVMDFYFFGGSMGSAIGEKIYLAMQLAIKYNAPLILVSSSGGARMQEGILSLMQMAKTCVGLEKMQQKKVPFISILTDPTMGGVTASFASLGDVIIAEPGALIGFAGPRVIEQTIRQKLPEGFQKAEFLLQHGFIDMIVPRHQIKEVLSRLITFFTTP